MDDYNCQREMYELEFKAFEKMKEDLGSEYIQDLKGAAAAKKLRVDRLAATQDVGEKKETKV